MVPTLPNGHWLPPNDMGWQDVLSRFNDALQSATAVDFCNNAFGAFLALARRYDLYNKFGYDKDQDEPTRFHKLLEDNLDWMEKTSLLALPSVYEIVDLEPIKDEAFMSRLRQMGDGAIRDYRQNPFKAFNNFKEGFVRYNSGLEAQDLTFDELVDLLYIIRKNMRRLSFIVDYLDEDRLDRDYEVVIAGWGFLAGMIAVYFFGIHEQKWVYTGDDVPPDLPAGVKITDGILLEGDSTRPYEGSSEVPCKLAISNRDEGTPPGSHLSELQTWKLVPVLSGGAIHIACMHYGIYPTNWKALEYTQAVTPPSE